MKEIRISIFCMIEELKEWTDYLCNKYGFQILIYETFDKYKLVNCSDANFEVDYIRIYLLPQNDVKNRDFSFKKITPIDLGWIDISPGGLIKNEGRKVVVLTEFCVSKSKGNKQDTWDALMDLRKVIKKQAKNNVVGKNQETSGKSSYKDIWYTNRAELSINSGIIWKQKVEYRSIFEPASR
jgi:hypothetical protein